MPSTFFKDPVQTALGEAPQHHIDFEQIQPGDHICFFYKTEDEHCAVLAPYIKTGLARNWRVLYVVDTHTAGELLACFRSAGIDAAPAIESGQLQILSSEETYLRDGSFDPEAMIGLLQGATDRSLADGYNGLCVTGEMTWVFRGAPRADQLVEYEAKLNQFLPGSQALAICQYDLRRFDSETINAVLDTHPHVILGYQLIQNDLYVEPETYLSADRPAREMKRRLEALEHKAKTQTDIRQLAKRSNALLDNSPLCHKVIDLDFKLQYMNKSGFEMLKLPVSDDIYGTPYPPDCFQEETKEALLEKLRHVRDTGEVAKLESPARDHEQNEIWLDHTLIPVFKEDGSIDYITVVSADITERIRMEERLRQSEKMDAIGQLAGGIAHDFNNQLSGIMGYAGLLLNKTEDPKIQRFAENISKGAKRSADLTKKLLAFSRKGQTEVHAVDIHPLIDEVADMLNRTIDKRIAINVKQKAKEAITRGDASLLENTILNLAINARDAMPDGGTLTIETANVKLNENLSLYGGFDISSGPYIALRVADTGCGMSKETIAHCFEPFFTTKAKGAGTGMGLAAVYGTVKQHKGAIGIESHTDRGTTFTVYLPQYTIKPPADDTDTRLLKAIRPGKVLVVDDEPIFLALTRDLLETAGHEAITASTPLEALALYRRQWRDIDVVVLDFNMPEMNGLETFHEVRSINLQVPVVFLSGVAISNALQERIDNKDVMYLQKPFEPPLFLETIETALSWKKQDMNHSYVI